MNEAALSDSGSTRRRRGRLVSRLGDIVFGTDERLRLRTQFMVLVMVIYLAWIGVVVIIHRHGMIGDTGFMVCTAIDVIGPATFYAMVRSGFSLRFKDVGLVEPQIILASVAIVVGYVYCEPLRAAMMQALCMAQVFGLLNLRPPEALRVGLVSALLLILALVAGPSLNPDDFNPATDPIRIAMSSFIVVLLAFTSRHYALMRQRVREQKTELARAVEQVNELATRDALTGLYNRQYMQEMLEQERSRLARSGTRFCIALIDLDHFKRINDTHGHQVGDEVLKAFAQSARAALRDSDVAARWGGEEFLLFMPATDPADNGSVGVQRLLDHIVSLKLKPELPDLAISFSAGVACVDDPLEPLDQMLDRADRALYQAKAAGRCRLVLAPPAAHSS